MSENYNPVGLCCPVCYISGEVREYKCDKCGHHLGYRGGAKFCSECGRSVNWYFVIKAEKQESRKLNCCNGKY